MTAARQHRKQHRACYRGFRLAACCAFCRAAASVAGGDDERIVADWHTGLAIGGYDPVAFYTDGKPVPGSPDVEFRYAGAIWRFSNVGNREAFAARPDVYMPQFGGYDPIGVSRGVAVAGNPDPLADHRRAAFSVLRSPPAGNIYI